MTTPILENDALMRKAKVGNPSKVKATLYNDHIEIHDKAGNILLNTPLNSLVDASYKGGTLGFKNWVVEFTVAGQYYVLDFMPLSQRLFFGFGLIGSLFGSKKSNSGAQIAKTWAIAMQQNGVQFSPVIV